MRALFVVVFLVFVVFRLFFIWTTGDTATGAAAVIFTAQEKSTQETTMDQAPTTYPESEVPYEAKDDDGDDYYVHLTDISKNNNDDDDIQEEPTFRNLRLVFLGDSLTRYQYLSLAYRLRSGRWFDPNIKVNNLVNAHSFHHPLHPKEDWNEFFLQSNRILHPMEICDCLRNHDGSMVLERRYFYDDVNNNMLVYINMNGKETSPGHGYYGRLEPEVIFGPRSHDFESLPFGMQAAGNYDESNIEWDFPSWGDVIRYHIGSLDYDYNREESIDETVHVLLNAGLHPHDFRNVSVASDINNALMATNLHGIWKTTTYPLKDLIEFQAQLKFSSQGPKIPYTRNTDRDMCRILGSCVNISWTSLLRADLYFDDLHFLEPVYRVMNEEYLEQLHLLPNGYTKANRSSILVEGASRWLS